LWTGHGTLISYQSVLAEDENRNPVELSRHPACERFVSRHTGDAGQQIDSVWRAAQLDQLLRFGEVGFSEAGIRETEVIQKIDELDRVFGRCPNQDIQIARVARPSVEGQAAPTIT
jgi:hypothetical protein